MAHRTLREHLLELGERGHEPDFQPAVLPPLVAMDELFATTDWWSVDVTKFLDDGQIVEVYHLTAETVAAAGEAPQAWEIPWSPVPAGVDPAAGFALGTTSVTWGGSAAVPPPDGPLTRAFLLLVTSDFVHLSASHQQDPPLVRGAVNGPGEEFEYVQLDRGTPDRPNP